MNLLLPLLRLVHTSVFSRRVRVLSDALSRMIPENGRILDIGCGCGSIGSALMRNKPTVSVKGIDVLRRRDCRIENIAFDGKTIPLPAGAVDLALLVDVLHHTDRIPELLDEASRVSSGTVLIKDHLCEDRCDYAILKFMDWVGNRHHGVALTYNYWSRKQWTACFASKGLVINCWSEELPLYPFPFQSIFGTGLHFIALLKKG